MWSTPEVIFAVMGVIAGVVLIAFVLEMFINKFYRED